MDSEPTTPNDCHPTERELLELNRNIQSEDPTIRLESVTQMGKLVSSEESPPVTNLVNRGNLAFLLRYLGKHDDPKLQIESAGILITFSSEETEGVVNAGGIPPLVGLLDPRNAENLREHGAWALGNIAGDSPQNRDRVLQAGALQPLLHCLTNSQENWGCCEPVVGPLAIYVVETLPLLFTISNQPLLSWVLSWRPLMMKFWGLFAGHCPI